jgi:ParB family transcriptional regulator, chromosome partitioning protein
MTKQALGRGFESLIPTDFIVGDVASPGEHIKNMDIDLVVANPDQPRKEFGETALLELSESIKQHGIIQPLVVTPHKDKFRIVAGERRYRASQLAGLKKVPVIVRNHEELEELEIALVENVQRVDLSPLEQAVSIVRLHDQFSMSYRDISKKLGKAETTISNIVRLLQLPKPAIEALRKNKITEGHARALLSLNTDTDKQNELLNNIITQSWTVRQAEAFVQTTKRVQEPTKRPRKNYYTIHSENIRFTRQTTKKIKFQSQKKQLVAAA